LPFLLDNQPITNPPRVDEEINRGESSFIKGEFTLDEAKETLHRSNAGALPVPLKIIQQRNIQATLGENSIHKSSACRRSRIAYCCLVYDSKLRDIGINSRNRTLDLYLIVFALFKIIPVTLTLAGIAGFILSIGMAVDANILIFERIKEEKRWGKDMTTAIMLGFDRAFSFHQRFQCVIPDYLCHIILVRYWA